MRIVAALGGNALLERGERPDSDIQQAHVVEAAAALAPLARDHELIVTHGNGPQVGMLALESEGDPALSHPYPFDLLGAQTQGLIGYWLAQALEQAAPGVAAACLITRTVVRDDDPAFGDPAKFVGPAYSDAEAAVLTTKRGWRLRPDGTRWRRVVPSPEPDSLVELDLIKVLAARGMVLVCAGGGGVPVIRAGPAWRGVDAVVDKDLTAALLARELAADFLLLLTDVEGVIDGFGTPAARPLRRVETADLRSRSFPAGSMGPKVDAACRFVEQTGGAAAIGPLGRAAQVLAGLAGTTVTPAAGER